MVWDNTQRGDIATLHRSESGVPDLYFDATAYCYAKQLARYITSAPTIRAHVKANYGVSLDLDSIRELQAKYQASRQRFTNAANQLGERSRDGIDFRVRGLVKKTVPDPDELTEEEIAQPRFRRPAIISEVIESVAAEFGFTMQEILGRGRKIPLVQARKTICKVLVERGNSNASVGRRLDRNHATIIHLIRAFDDYATPKMREIAARYIGGGDEA